ncbi:MAG: recombinase family protein [Acidobacteria bacterium]|nr:recombinase family protein [Acidobacteriota bacterium]
MNTLRVAIYARVSTADKGQDTENQLRELRQFVGSRSSDGWIIAGEYVDQMTGKTANRPEFRRLFQDASERKFDLALFWSLDRLSREGVVETLQHLERLKASGVQWWSLKEEYLRSIGPFADAVLAILACIAKQERIRLSERVKAGLDRARSQGKAIGRPKLVVDRHRVQQLHQQGLSHWDISQKLGISRASVGRILTGNGD